MQSFVNGGRSLDKVHNIFPTSHVVDTIYLKMGNSQVVLSMVLSKLLYTAFESRKQGLLPTPQNKCLAKVPQLQIDGSKIVYL